LVIVALAGAIGWVWWKGGRAMVAPPATGPVTPTIRQIVIPPPATNSAVPKVAMPATNPIAQAPPADPGRTAPDAGLNKAAAPVQKPAPLADTPAAPAPAPDTYPRPVTNVFEAQVVLVRHALSPGSIDGNIGPQTRAALSAFQSIEGLPVTGRLDLDTKARLVLEQPALTNYMVEAADVARLQLVSRTWLGKSQQSSLEYETLPELVAEKFLASPTFIRTLNPRVNWETVSEGTALVVPNAAYPEPTAKAAFVRISLAERCLDAFDSETNLLVHFPCSIAQRAEKRPYGELYVSVIIPNPNYTFDPDVFPESEEGRQLGRKLVVPPGPNNPVGVTWIGLDLPGYGIHGTPQPEQVGRTESHGCFRLANWNAAYLMRLVKVGTPVYVLP
jgi:lipoprotein-anchoring transpeptidase ErfK/SrfK